MARTAVSTAPMRVPSGGFNTEASPLAFPANGAIVDKNLEVVQGSLSRRRRLGLSTTGTSADAIDTGFNAATGGADIVTQTYLWTSVGNRGDNDLLVIRLNDDLYFYRNNFQFALQDQLAVVNIPGLSDDITCTFTSLFGRLIMTWGQKSVLVFSQDSSNPNNITYEQQTLEVRDLWGVESGLDGTVRVKTSTGTVTGDVQSAGGSPDAYYYNMYNQGWPWEGWYMRRTGGGSPTEAFGNVIQDGTYAFNATAEYLPSENDSFFAYTQVTSDFFYSAYAQALLESTPPSSSPAARGKNVMDVFNRGLARQAFLSKWTESTYGGGSLPVDRTDGSIGQVAAFAGRVFYAFDVTGEVGLDENSPRLGTTIMYSQTATSIREMGRCYAKNDPTARDINEPLATDGGYVSIPEIGKIYKLAPFGNSLFIFASNGIWEINGGDSGFSATNQQLNKVSNVGVVSESAITLGDAAISVWSKAGIELLTIDPATGQGMMTNLTENTIQSFYDALPTSAKRDAIGIYNPSRKEFRWLYGIDTARSGIYNRELVLKVATGGFFLNELATPLAEQYGGIIGFRPNSDLSVSAETDDVVVGSDPVVVGADQVVVNTETALSTGVKATNYLALRINVSNLHIWEAHFIRDDFLDWGETDAEAMLVTGWLVGDDPAKSKRATYVNVLFGVTEDDWDVIDEPEDGNNFDREGACNFQLRWQWTKANPEGTDVSSNSNRWSTPRQIYQLPRLYGMDWDDDIDDELPWTITKVRHALRGHGNALSMVFRSEVGKDMWIHGYTLEISQTELGA